MWTKNDTYVEGRHEFVMGQLSPSVLSEIGMMALMLHAQQLSLVISAGSAKQWATKNEVLLSSCPLTSS